MEGVTYWTATNIYVTPTTLSGITFNFLMSLSGGLLAGYVIAKGDPFWTYSSGLAGIALRECFSAKDLTINLKNIPEIIVVEPDSAACF